MMDLAKLLAAQLSLRSVLVPSLASTPAAVTSHSVLHTDHDEFVGCASLAPNYRANTWN